MMLVMILVTKLSLKNADTRSRFIYFSFPSEYNILSVEVKRVAEEVIIQRMHQILYYKSSPSLFRSDRLLEYVSIALVGKYTKLADSYTSVIKALEHSALAINHKLEVKVRRQLSSNF